MTSADPFGKPPRHEAQCQANVDAEQETRAVRRKWQGAWGKEMRRTQASNGRAERHVHDLIRSED
jgi:hypothetical protein